MASKLDIPLHGSAVNIVRRYGSAVTDVLNSKFGCVVIIDGVEFDKDAGVAQQKRPTVVPEKRLEVTLSSGVKVSVWKADLTTFPVDAVVNAANEGLQHYGGLAHALSMAGGPEIQTESNRHTSVYGNLRTGDAVVHDAGSLPCNKIIHAVGPQLSKNPSQADVSQAESKLRSAIWSILERVKENGLQSVAIPAVSSGLFHYPLDQCARAIVETVKRYYEKSYGHQPREIMLVNHDDPTVKEMERAVHQILAPNKQHAYTYSQAANKGLGNAKTSTCSVQIGNVHLTLMRGHIEDQETHVIVNTTYDRDLRVGQISKAILHKAGHEMQTEMLTAALIGRLVITKPYRLQCKVVYHTLCVNKGTDPAWQGAARQILFDSVLECLKLASTSGYKSISFPAIGTGGLGFNKDEAAHIMSKAVFDFAQHCPKKTEVCFVIFPSDKETFKAFEKQMSCLQQLASNPSSTHEFEQKDDFPECTSPQISLYGSSDAIREAERWLRGLLFDAFGSVTIYNNFIQHFGVQEHVQLSRQMKGGVIIEERFDKGHASIVVKGDSDVDVIVAAFQVEAILCSIQKEFVREEECIMLQITSQNVSFKRIKVDYNKEFDDIRSDFSRTGLQIVKADKVENDTLKRIFDLKKKQLGCSSPQKMFQRIPVHFCEMVSNIGFHAEYAPPDDPAYGEGIYFTSTVRKALDVWRKPDAQYLHFVEAEVLTGKSTPGKPGLILPPAVGTDTQILYDSVSGGSDISVIFSGYQALPKYIITCKKFKV